MTDSRTTVALRKVLLVDDDHRLLRSYRLQLSPSFVVLTASNGTEARERAVIDRPDLAIIDVHLGTENGVDVLRDLKLVLPDLRVAMISAHATNDLASFVVRAGAEALLQKPATSAEVMRRLEDKLPPELEHLKPATIARVEYEHIARVVNDVGNITKAARLLGLDRSTIQRKLKDPAPK